MKKIFFISLLMWLFSFTARAGNIDFEDTDVYKRQTAAFTSGELTFTPSDYVYTWGIQPGADNGTTSLIAGYGTYTGFEPKGFFSFKETDGNLFTFDSMDVGTTWYSKGEGSVEFIGHQLGGVSVSKTLSLVDSYKTFLFGWTNLLYVDVMPNSKQGYVAYDNIAVTVAPFGFDPNTAPKAVPITAAVWLFGSALSGLIGLGARRQSKGLMA